MGGDHHHCSLRLVHHLDGFLLEKLTFVLSLAADVVDDNKPRS